MPTRLTGEQEIEQAINDYEAAGALTRGNKVRRPYNRWMDVEDNRRKPLVALDRVMERCVAHDYEPTIDDVLSALGDQ
jgi:hypothetical protein